MGSSEKMGAMSFFPGMSPAPKMPATPGACSALEMSTETILAWAWGLTTGKISSVPGRFGMSST